MITIERKTIQSIPLLEVVAEQNRNKEVGTIFFFHGFTSYKEVNLHYAYFLAEEGFRVILPDCEYHGERASDKARTFPELGLNFWNIIIQAIQELQVLRDEYVVKGKTDPGKVGVAGTSMGGFITLGALTQYDWISAAVSLMGCPAYIEFAKLAIRQFKKDGHFLPFSDVEIKRELERLSRFDLSLHPEKLKQRPLLFWHGEKDTIVPYRLAYEFYQTVKEDYRAVPERLQFIGDPQAEHKVTRRGVEATVRHFQTFLR